MIVTSTHATCTKEQVFTLLEKDFSKKEINSVCGIESRHRFLAKHKWVDASAISCTKYNGKMVKNTCRANWHQAKQICENMHLRLASAYELKMVVQECGGVIDDNTNNRRNKAYQACYKEYGFLDASFNDHWSSNTNLMHEEKAWIVSFVYGFTYSSDKRNSFYVRCAK